MKGISVALPSGCRGYLAVFSVLCSLLLASTVYGKGRVVTFTTMNWEPMYGESLLEGGVYTAVAREAFARVGYQLNVQFFPWRRAYELAKSGQYTGLLGAVFSPERVPFFQPTQSLMLYEEFLFSPIDNNVYYKKFSSLRPYTVGVVSGTAIETLLQSEGVKTRGVTTYQQNLQKLMAGRIDLMVADQFKMGEMLKSYPEFQGKVKALEPAIQKTGLPLLISKKYSDYQTIQEDFDRGLQEILSDGTYNKIITRFGFSGLKSE